MMGLQTGDQSQLFYLFNLERRIPASHLLRRRLAASVGVGIESKIDGPRPVAELKKLTRIQMIAQRAGDVVEACLPQDRVVKQPFDENDLRATPDLLPGVQSTFTGRQKTVGSRGIEDAAAIEIVVQRKDDAVGIGIATAGIHKAGRAKCRKRIT